MQLVSEYYAALQEQINREGKAVAAGNASSYEDYARRVGIIKGLELAATILTELVKTKPGEDRV